MSELLSYAYISQFVLCDYGMVISRSIWQQHANENIHRGY
jgi:hypothetical protein